jgi:hypothetical protein
MMRQLLTTATAALLLLALMPADAAPQIPPAASECVGASPTGAGKLVPYDPQPGQGGGAIIFHWWQIPYNWEGVCLLAADLQKCLRNNACANWDRTRLSIAYDPNVKVHWQAQDGTSGSLTVEELVAAFYPAVAAYPIGHDLSGTALDEPYTGPTDFLAVNAHITYTPTMEGFDTVIVDCRAAVNPPSQSGPGISPGTVLTTDPTLGKPLAGSTGYRVLGSGTSIASFAAASCATTVAGTTVSL